MSPVPATGPTADLPQSGYVCARSFAKRNPNTIRSFQTALRGAQVAAQDRTGIERELTGYLKVTSTVASLMGVNVDRVISFTFVLGSDFFAFAKSVRSTTA